MQFTLTKATEADFEFLLALRLATMDEHLKAANLYLDGEKHRQRVKENYDCSYIIAKDNAQIGLAKYAHTDTAVTVYQLQILPAYQGQGLGRSVLDYIIQQAGSKPVCLTVLKQNPALRLYESMGFSHVGEDDYEYHLQYHN